MNGYKIIADPDVNPNAVAAVQAVPLNDPPFVGSEPWGSGTTLPIEPVTKPKVQDGHKVFWGVWSWQFYDSDTDTGYDDGTGPWNAARAVAQLTGTNGVTIITYTD